MAENLGLVFDLLWVAGLVVAAVLYRKRLNECRRSRVALAQLAQRLRAAEAENEQLRHWRDAAYRAGS